MVTAKGHMQQQREKNMFHQEKNQDTNEIPSGLEQNAEKVWIKIWFGQLNIYLDKVLT